MKQIAILIGLFLISSAVFADGALRNIENFTELRVSESINVQLFKGEKNSAKVKVSSGDDTAIKLYVENGILRILWKKGADNNRIANIDLYYTSLNTIKASAGAKISSTEIFESKDLTLDSSSGSKINLEVNCDKLIANINSGASMTLTGKTGSQEIELSSGAKYISKDLISETTNIEASSGATAEVHASQTINAEASTGARIKYAGNPSNKEIEENKYSGGKVNPF